MVFGKVVYFLEPKLNSQNANYVVPAGTQGFSTATAHTTVPYKSIHGFSLDTATLRMRYAIVNDGLHNI